MSRIGDKVKVKSIEWYNANKDSEDSIRPSLNSFAFIDDMSNMCGKIVTITDIISPGAYIVAESKYKFEDYMLEDNRIRFKKLVPSAIIPNRAHITDAGLDIYGVSYEWDTDGNLVVHTGIAMSVPEGYVTLLFPRSSISKTPMRLTNSVGIIDCSYRGEIMAKFKVTDVDNYVPDLTKAIAQLVVIKLPELDIVEVEELDETDRGAGGYGSTDK